jgi:hypothetical protein
VSLVQAGNMLGHVSDLLLKGQQAQSIEQEMGKLHAFKKGKKK